MLFFCSMEMTGEEDVFGGANKRTFLVGRVFDRHQFYHTYDSGDPNGRVPLIQVPSTWDYSLYANTRRRFEGMKYGPLRFINIKDMVIKDTRIKSIEMTTSSERTIQTTCVHKETMDTVAVSGVSKVIGEVFHRQQFSRKKHMNAQLVRDYMDLLPNEVIQEEVLIRLHVKMLMRLMCVSKDLKDLISDYYFRRRYQSLQQANGNTPMGFICGDRIDDYASQDGFCMANKFLYTSENYVEKEELESLTRLNKFGYVIAASKGLLLVSHDVSMLSVYDLVSNKHVNLPMLKPVVNDLYVKESCSRVALGFKCEESSNHHFRFKVVCVEYPCIRLRHKRLKIYSSETGIWRTSYMKSELLLPFQIEARHVAKLIRGVFYWHESSSNSFIAYDSEDPKCRVVLIKLPNIKRIHHWKKVRQLEGTKDGSLQFISKDVGTNVLKVWILQSFNYMDEDIVDASRWDLAYSVSLCDTSVGFRGFCETCFSRIIAIDPVDPHIIYLCIEERLYAYNYRQGKVVFTLSPKLAYETDMFVHFEWPTWPRL